jgi:Zn-dependent protease
MLKNVTPKKITFTKTEVEHLIKSWLLISSIFAIALTIGQIATIFSLKLISNFLISLVTVGIGFVAHEMAHKILAQKNRCHAEYRADFKMLFGSFILALLGFIFIAPGAVIIKGYITRKQNGIISLVGPIANFLVALLFIPLIILGNPLFVSIAYFGFKVNTWLGIFNLIPFGNLDGRKVLAWDKGIYFSSVGFGIIMMIIGNIILA